MSFALLNYCESVMLFGLSTLCHLTVMLVYRLLLCTYPTRDPQEC